MKELADLLRAYATLHEHDDDAGTPTAALVGDDELVSWREVKRFIAMAEHALSAKQRVAEESTKCSHAREEQSSFLEGELANIYGEKESLLQRVRALTTDKQSLGAEVALLRQQLGEWRRPGTFCVVQPLQGPL
jgi:hypothetical protein